MGPKAQRRLGRAAAYYAAIHQVRCWAVCGVVLTCIHLFDSSSTKQPTNHNMQEVLWPFYSSSLSPLPLNALRLAWLRRRIDETSEALGMRQPVAPGSLRPCNADGSYDDDSLRWVGVALGERHKGGGGWFVVVG